MAGIYFFTSPNLTLQHFKMNLKRIPGGFLRLFCLRTISISLAAVYFGPAFLSACWWPFLSPFGVLDFTFKWAGTLECMIGTLRSPALMACGAVAVIVKTPSEDNEDLTVFWSYSTGSVYLRTKERSTWKEEEMRLGDFFSAPSRVLLPCHGRHCVQHAFLRW